MSVLVTADLHFSDIARDAYRFSIFDWLAKTMDEEGVSHLVVLGDLTELKDEHPSTLVNRVVAGFGRLRRIAPVTIIRGNHDYLNPDYPFFRFIENVNGIEWINAPQVKEDRTLGRRVIYLPHTINPDADWHAIDFRSGDLVFAHNTFNGAVSESGKTLSGISVDRFPRGVEVVAGDIHKPQTYGVVTYVGAPYTIDFGDDYEPRVLLFRKDRPRRSIPVGGVQKRLYELESLDELDDITL